MKFVEADQQFHSIAIRQLYLACVGLGASSLYRLYLQLDGHLSSASLIFRRHDLLPLKPEVH